MTKNVFVGIAIVMTALVVAYCLDRDGDGRIAVARPVTGTLDDFGRFYFREVSERVMYRGLSAISITRWT